MVVGTVPAMDRQQLFGVGQLLFGHQNVDIAQQPSGCQRQLGRDIGGPFQQHEGLFQRLQRLFEPFDLPQHRLPLSLHQRQGRVQVVPWRLRKLFQQSGAVQRVGQQRQQVGRARLPDQQAPVGQAQSERLLGLQAESDQPGRAHGVIPVSWSSLSRAMSRSE